MPGGPHAGLRKCAHGLRSELEQAASGAELCPEAPPRQSAGRQTGGGRPNPHAYPPLRLSGEAGRRPQSGAETVCTFRPGVVNSMRDDSDPKPILHHPRSVKTGDAAKKQIPISYDATRDWTARKKGGARWMRFASLPTHPPAMLDAPNSPTYSLACS